VLTLAVIVTIDDDDAEPDLLDGLEEDLRSTDLRNVRRQAANPSYTYFLYRGSKIREPKPFKGDTDKECRNFIRHLEVVFLSAPREYRTD